MIKWCVHNLIIPITLLLGCALSTSATTYFISTAGNDSASGTSVNTPWKTIAKVNASAYTDGDSILFKRGETWREELTVPAHGLYIAAYGTGNKPLFLGSNLIPTWVQHDTTVWRGTFATINPEMIYVNGVRGKKRPTIAECDSVGGILLVL